ncbi:MAG TPA: PDZ domain-containing protein, partial [Chitinophagaceae bacterium]
MGSKKLQVWLPVLFAFVMIIGMAIGFQLREKTAGVAGFFQLKQSNPIEEILDLVHTRYVDNVSDDSLFNSAIGEILAKLDPHSVYLPPEDLKFATEDLQGNFQGIGVEFQVFNDTVNVINVIKGGPSDKAGVKVGDRMIAVEDTISLVKREADDIRGLLRGPKNSDVDVTVIRDGNKRKINITRGVI